MTVFSTKLLRLRVGQLQIGYVQQLPKDGSMGSVKGGVLVAADRTVASERSITRPE